MKLRALFGLWEGESTTFLGAVEWDVYECLPQEDWDARCEEWKKDWACTDFREADINMPGSKLVHLFDAPLIPATVASPIEGDED